MEDRQFDDLVKRLASGSISRRGVLKTLIAGAVGALALATAVRWSSQEIAGIGIVGSLLAPVFVDAGPHTSALVFMTIALIAAIGAVLRPLVERIPRSFLQLLVGLMLTAFGTFWALEGLNVNWPQSDFDIVLLAIFYALVAGIYIVLERRARQRVLEVVGS